MTYKTAIQRSSTERIFRLHRCEFMADWPLFTRLLVSVLVLCFSFSGEALAQNVQYTNKATDLGLRSTQRVNPITRAVEFQIPLGNYPGRAGLDVPVVLSYSSKLWDVKFQGYNSGPPPPHGGMQPFTIVTADYAKHSIAGWTSSIGFPVIDPEVGNQIYNPSGTPNVNGDCTLGCYIVDRMLVWMPDGSGHELRASDQPRFFTNPAPDNFYSVDGTRMRYQLSTATLYLADGSQYQFGTQKYVDRNGNTLTWVGGWRDTLDRTINSPLPYNVGVGPLSPTDQTYSIPGVANTFISYTLKWRNLADVLMTPEPMRYIADGGCPPGQSTFSPYLFQYDGVSRTCFGNGGVLFNPVVLSQIVLPNGQTYTFSYDIFGAINKVVLPTGGYEKFEYAYTGGISSPVNFQWVYAQVNRGVTRHVVSPNGSGGDEIETLYTGNGNLVSMTAPDGSRKETYVWTDAGSVWGYSVDSSRAGMPFDERIYSASGQMLRRTLTEWAMTPSNATGNPPSTQNANRNARMTREVELILDTGGPVLAKSTTYGYDTTHQYTVGVERTAINEFDYVEIDQNTAQTVAIGSLGTIPNGTLLRTTESDYLTGDNNYRARNILGLVTATRIKNGAGTIVAQSANSYDEAVFPLLTYTSVLNWIDPATTYRGNVTTVTSWLNFNGSTLSSFPQGTSVASHTQYDQCGSARKTWNAKDTSLTNPTQTDYSNTYHRAYPTTQTSSDPDGAGPLTSLVTSTEYDFSTGLVTAAIDANAQRTTFTYGDSLNRLTQTIRASTDASAKNQTTYTYNDVARTLTTTSDLTTYNDNILKTVTVFDGLGRLLETQQYESPTSYITTQQQYDQLGRVFKTSNPFRPLQGENALWTTQQFDALGRLISLTTLDSAVVSTTYSGNTVLLTDQIGKQRKSVMDALGRLKQVYEAPNEPSYNYLTSYDYDTLNNLVKVTQGTQFRYFMYDSLKRLIRSRNPEQGTLASLDLSDPLTLNVNWSSGFQYDNISNLAQETDARGVVTNHAYDALSRNLSISYSNDPASTPAVTFTYDTATNGKGRLRQSQTANTSRTTIDSYDAIGRPSSQQQEFYVSGAWGQSYVTQRTYNLGGGVTSQTYPSNHVVNYVYDNAGRVNGFSGNLGDGLTRTYSTEVVYSPFGGLAKEKFGTATPVYNKLFYNNRGQLAEIRESTSYTGSTDMTADRGAIVNHYSGLCSGMCTPTATMTDNNGNLRKQEILIPDQTTRLQRYEYDGLNRLSLAKEELSGVEQWKQQFTYDRWGNRTIDLGETYGVSEKGFTVNPGNNRLEVPVGETGVMAYDFAGNLINDTYTGAGTRIYDGENRIISAWGGNNQAQAYGYDAAGSRIKRKLDGVETWQVYGFDGELLAEYTANGAPGTPQKEYGYRNGQLLITGEPSPTPPVNVALAANGATVTASSSYSGFSASGAINGDRRGLYSWQDGWWSAAAAGFPAWLEVQFNGSKTISEIDVVTIQDNYTSPIEPTDTMTSSTYGLSGYEVQYWNGSAWVTVSGGSVTGNNKVWRKFSFVPITTTKIRVLGNAAPDGVSRLAELEAWTGPSPAPRYNLAMGATATASSIYAATHAAACVINGDRKGLNAGNGGNWQDAPPTNTFPDWLQLDFGTNKTINEVDVFSLQDNWTNPVEPTESMTFTLYGMSGFDVQYWDGSNWMTVPGGSVTGNNKIWKKVTFAPITTSKIRVLTHASPYGYSVLTEVEVYGPAESGGTGGVKWLVADQLGTPRMILDQTGNLANMTRHDYLPFGEELFTPVGGRSTAQGYSGGDGVRQQFTSQERDFETGLDYFLARYYSSGQGRFLSVDPDNAQGMTTPDDPQGWNAYSYVGNNPLTRTDPDGRLSLVKSGDAWQRFRNWFNYGRPVTDEQLKKEVDKKRAELKAHLRAMDGHEYTPEEFDRMSTMQVLRLYDRFRFGIDAGVGREVPPVAPMGGTVPPRAPQHVQNTVTQIEKTGGKAPQGFRGGQAFNNDARGGGQTLPRTDAQGGKITYREYDVHPYRPGVNRGAERVVRGSDGSVYYTADHYKTFTKLK